MNIEAQIASLTSRVSALEAEVQGQQRYNCAELREDVAIVRSHAVGLGQRFDALEAKFSTLEAKFPTLEVKFSSLEAKVSTEIGGLRRDLPGIIAETMREVLREGK